MFVLGVDPGVSRCGYGCIEAGGGAAARAVALGVLTTPPDAPLACRMAAC